MTDTSRAGAHSPGRATESETPVRKSVFTRACTACFVLTFCLAATIASSAQTLTTLHTFPFSQGNFAPNTPMVQGQDGNFYGTTGLGGDIGQGTSFKLTTQGAFINLDTFCTYSALGCNPLYGGNPHGLILGLDGNFYGFTWDGGPNSDSSVCFSGCGTIFKMTPGGALSLIYGFCAQTGCTDGAQPTSLVQGPDGNFYGTTALAGGSTANCFIGLYDFCGTVFKLTPQGVLTTLHNFCAQKNCADGEYGASLMIASNGNLYGTTLSGGSSAYGVIFQITPAGTYSVLKNFPFGYGPDFNQLIQGSNGDLFGTSNGSNSSSYPGYVFRMTLNGSFSVLHTFCSQPGCADGNTPWNGLVQGTDGSLYGTTREGGANNSKYCSGVGCGTIFSISPQGTFTTLYNFCSQANCADGNSPNGSLIQGTDGKFYGATPNGGNGGTLFSFDVGLGPFIEALPAYGRVGQSTRILGNNLTGTTSVSFNGTPATFTVIGDTLVTATVPVGATTGPIELTTSIGTLSTNVPFFVRH